MRIAVYHDLPTGGAKRALQAQVRELVALGHTVDVFAPSTAEERFLPLAGVASSVRVFELPEPPAREKALSGRASLLDALRWARHLARLFRLEREIAAAIDAGGYDVALVHPSQHTQAPLVLRRLRTPSLYYCQEPLRAAYEPRIAPWPVRLAVRQTIGRVDRAAVRAATLVAVNSRFSAGNVRRVYGIEPRLAYLGVDFGAFEPRPVRPGDYVLTVGALHPLKGIDFLVEALGRVPAPARPPLVVVSDRVRASERERVVALAARRSVRLELRERVSETELVALYRAARLVLYAPYAEPFGFVPLEAMACARPVLGVAEGGIPETVREGETGFLAPRDPGAFAARIAALLADSEAAEAVARRAADEVRRRWSWSASVATLVGLLCETAAAVPTTRLEEVST